MSGVRCHVYHIMSCHSCLHSFFSAYHCAMTDVYKEFVPCNPKMLSQLKQSVIVPRRAVPPCQQALAKYFVPSTRVSRPNPQAEQTVIQYRGVVLDIGCHILDKREEPSVSKQAFDNHGCEQCLRPQWGSRQTATA